MRGSAGTSSCRPSFAGEREREREKAVPLSLGEEEGCARFSLGQGGEAGEVGMYRVPLQVGGAEPIRRRGTKPVTKSS